MCVIRNIGLETISSISCYQSYIKINDNKGDDKECSNNNLSLFILLLLLLQHELDRERLVAVL